MFDNESFSHVGGSSPAPRIYTYETLDGRTVVLAAGYFNEAYTKLQVKDLIIVNNSTEVYTAKVTAVSKNSVVVEKTSFLDREYAYYYLSTETVLSLNNDGVTYTEVPNMAIGPVRDFTLADNTLTYTGVGGLFQFIGSVDMSSQKVADVTIALLSMTLLALSLLCGRLRLRTKGVLHRLMGYSKLILAMSFM
jgi:hypothetical protein